MYSNALSIFMFKINPFQVVITQFINGSQIYKIPKYSIYLTHSRYDNATCHMVWISKDLDTLKIVQFICLGGKIGENVLKYFGI
jgi:hypothetical protein